MHSTPSDLSSNSLKKYITKTVLNIDNDIIIVYTSMKLMLNLSDWRVGYFSVVVAQADQKELV